MDYEDAWLEARACAGGQAADAGRAILEVPAIAEVLEAASGASRRPGLWDYSRRLDRLEVQAVKGALAFARTAEDGRSVSYSADVAYKGSCYTLTLFAVKRSQ